MAKREIIPLERIQKAILVIRDQKVLLDADLAVFYGVETKALVRAVKRNTERFPEDFMFQLTKTEFETLRCQIGTSNGRGGRRYAPYAFTEQGVAMLWRSAFADGRADQHRNHARFRGTTPSGNTL
ncbi:MAG: ORF6N domain-containing protein [Planctomycetota bacterium]|jgi:hypothetical protein